MPLSSKDDDENKIKPMGASHTSIVLISTVIVSTAANLPLKQSPGHIWF